MEVAIQGVTCNTISNLIQVTPMLCILHLLRIITKHIWDHLNHHVVSITVNMHMVLKLWHLSIHSHHQPLQIVNQLSGQK